METTTILGGIVTIVISGAVGKYIGSNGKVKDTTCIERQHACSNLLGVKIDNLTAAVEELKKAVNGKLLGL